MGGEGVGAHRGPDLQRSLRRASSSDGSSAAPRAREVKTMKPGNEGGKTERGQIQWKEMDSRSSRSSFQLSAAPPPPVPQGGCHGDRRPHVLGASFLVKGAHCSRVKPSSVCPSARDGGFGFTPRTKTQSPPCCVEVHGAQRPSHAFKRGAGGRAAAITLANQPTEANTRVWKSS